MRSSLEPMLKCSRCGVKRLQSAFKRSSTVVRTRTCLPCSISRKLQAAARTVPTQKEEVTWETFSQILQHHSETQQLSAGHRLSLDALPVTFGHLTSQAWRNRASGWRLDNGDVDRDAFEEELLDVKTSLSVLLRLIKETGGFRYM